jgi:sirohydrochlorin ferrochelatase
VVGDPKTLDELDGIEAQVRVTCRGCKASEVWELNALIAEVRKNGGNTEWRAARWSIKCPNRCASPLIDLLPLPFGKRRARREAYRHALINLSLQILREATARSASEAVGTLEVRLALHVLRPFVREQALLNRYWMAATETRRHPWNSCHKPYRSIVERLITLKADVEPKNLP